MKQNSIETTFSVFLIALTLFMYEISLTRLFSTILTYHFVFAAISLSMLGLTIGSVRAFSWVNKNKELENSLVTKKLLILGALGFTIALSVLLLYKIPYDNILVPIYLSLSTLPFIFGGYYLSLAFKEWVAKSNTLYFADLLGAATGSVLIMLLLNNLSIISVGLILSFVPVLVLCLHLPQYKKKLAGVTSVVIIISLLITQPSLIDPWAKDFGAYKGNPKMLSSISGNTKIEYTHWDSLARTDVIVSDEIEEKIVLVDGAAASYMIPFAGNLKEIQYLKYEPGYFPFAYRESKSALLIGPGGGKDILLAHLAGVNDITAVEINAGVVKASEELKDFSGNIYRLDKVTTHIGDGRSFISRDDKKYDIIFLSLVMTQSAESLGYALSENYIYTKEAFESYFNHLNPDGTLAFILHGVNDLAKATATLYEVFKERGVTREQANKYMAIVSENNPHNTGSNHGSQIMYPLLLVKKSPFTVAESEKIVDLAVDANTPIISLPYLHERLAVITPPEEVASNYLVTDNYPFFYNTGRSAPLTIISMLIIAFLIGNILIRRYSSTIQNGNITFFKRYFSYIGVAFMLIEIPLIQKLILLFGHPTLTFSAVIAIVLLTAGLGSLLSKEITQKIPLKLIGILIFSYTVILYLILPQFIFYLQGSGLSTKILATLLLLLPLGLLMGILFPSGLHLIEESKKSNLVPLMWGINGWMSVIGSILALVLAMSFGYNFTLLLGAGIYLVLSYHIFEYERCNA